MAPKNRRAISSGPLQSFGRLFWKCGSQTNRRFFHTFFATPRLTSGLTNLGMGQQVWVVQRCCEQIRRLLFRLKISRDGALKSYWPRKRSDERYMCGEWMIRRFSGNSFDIQEVPFTRQETQVQSQAELLSVDCYLPYARPPH